MTEARTYMGGYSDGKEWAQQTTAAGASPVEPSQEWKPALSPATISTAPACLNTNDKAMWVLGWNECLNAQPPAPGEAAREYMTGYSDCKECAGATNQAQPEPEPEQLTQLARESGFYQEPDTSLMPSTAAEKWLHCKQADIVRFADAVLQQAQPERAPLTDAEIEKLREKTFSTNSPFCPVDSKSMRKAVRAAEAAHGIKQGGQHD